MKPAPASNSSTRRIVWRNWVALCLGVFGLAAMAGDLTGSRTLKGLGAISTAAPYPKVFCDLGGYEGFASEFTIHYDTFAGNHVELPITPEVYTRLTGPYNRRNAYGTALAGAPILPEAMWQSVFHYGFKLDGPLRKEFGLPHDATNIFAVIQTKTKGNNKSWTLKPSWIE